MNIMYFCIYLYLLLKPFYIFKSGSMQPSDFFLIIAFIFLILSKNKLKISEIIKKNRKFVIFVLCVAIINLFYFIIYTNTKFLLSTTYFIFNLIGIIVFSSILDNQKVKSNIKNIFKLNLVIQLIILFAGLGRYYTSVRYMGTFNDPNQFGYYILISYMFINLISYDLKNSKGDIIFLIISIFLILESASTGMLLGISCFLFFKVIDIARIAFMKFRKYFGKIVLYSIFIIPLVVFAIYLNNSYKFINMDKFFVFSRVQEKFNKADSSTNDVSLIQERGYDRFIYYPQYVLYGSGEGEYTRFELTYHQDEIHATFPSILFYYGIIPFIILMLWVKENIFPSKITVLVPIFAIFLESFTLLNQRQLLFWIVIVYVSYVNKNNNEVKKDE